MSYRLIDTNKIALGMALDDILEMDCIYADLPNGLDGKHYVLKESNAKEPIDVIDDFGDRRLCCPNCIKPIVNVWNTRAYKPNYCQYCGQRFNWEVEE